MSSSDKTFHFVAPFPWIAADWSRLIELFKNEDFLKVTWWWEPFHRVGFQALHHSATKKIDALTLHSSMNNLSCVTPPPRTRRSFGARGLLDDEGRVKSLDPQVQIQRTLRTAGPNLEKFNEGSPRLPLIRDLRRELAGYFESWIPELENLEEYSTVSNWLTKSPGLVNRFHNLGRWEQLELMESLVGPLISSSEVNFVRVYLKS
jgi:hypothetical protein